MRTLAYGLGLRLSLGISISVGLHAADGLIDREQRYTTIRTPSLEFFIPGPVQAQDHALAHWAEAAYQDLAQALGHGDTALPIPIVIDKRSDNANGSSTVLPLPLITLQTAPGRIHQSPFGSPGGYKRILIHEFVHHLSNDRTYGSGTFLTDLFGRVLPQDPISLLLAYGTTPAHQTMPAFWHEGTAQWAESLYSSQSGHWRGRRYDPMTHMQWRLDAAGPGIPEVDTWKLSYHQWPFANQAYSYGLAYIRFFK